MNLNKLKSMAEKQLQDPKRRAQVEKLVTTAKTKIESRRGKPGGEPTPPSTGRPAGE